MSESFKETRGGNDSIAVTPLPRCIYSDGQCSLECEYFEEACTYDWGDEE